MEARLEAVKRDTFGKNEARRLRVKGHIPAVLYGGAAVDGKPQATPIAVDPKALMGILHGESGVNTLIGLKVGERGRQGAHARVPGRPADAPAAARGLLPDRDGQDCSS